MKYYWNSHQTEKSGQFCLWNCMTFLQSPSDRWMVRSPWCLGSPGCSFLGLYFQWALFFLCTSRAQSHRWCEKQTHFYRCHLFSPHFSGFSSSKLWHLWFGTQADRWKNMVWSHLSPVQPWYPFAPWHSILDLCLKPNHVFFFMHHNSFHVWWNLQYVTHLLSWRLRSVWD